MGVSRPRLSIQDGFWGQSCFDLDGIGRVDVLIILHFDRFPLTISEHLVNLVESVESLTSNTLSSVVYHRGCNNLSLCLTADLTIDSRFLLLPISYAREIKRSGDEFKVIFCLKGCNDKMRRASKTSCSAAPVFKWDKLSSTNAWISGVENPGTCVKMAKMTNGCSGVGVELRRKGDKGSIVEKRCLKLD